MSSSDGSHELNFVVHWLNNKELQFTQEAERMINELANKRNTPSPDDIHSSEDNLDTEEEDGSGSQTEPTPSESSDPTESLRSRLYFISQDPLGIWCYRPSVSKVPMTPRVADVTC